MRITLRTEMNSDKRLHRKPGVAEATARLAGPAAQGARWPFASRLGGARCGEPRIKSGDLRALAVTSEQRWFSPPDVPNDRVRLARVRLGHSGDAASGSVRCRVQGRLQIVAGGPEQLARPVAAEIEGRRGTVARAGIKPENRAAEPLERTPQEPAAAILRPRRGSPHFV
jgi:hypothetical protein